MKLEQSRHQKLVETIFFVESNSFETHMLWREYKNEVGWQQDHMGFLEVIGYIDGDIEKPVCVSFIFNFIHGKRVCFYDACSRFIDSEMVEKWIQTNYPVKWDNNTRIAMTNAMNFHHAVEAAKNHKKING